MSMGNGAPRAPSFLRTGRPCPRSEVGSEVTNFFLPAQFFCPINAVKSALPPFKLDCSALQARLLRPSSSATVRFNSVDAPLQTQNTTDIFKNLTGICKNINGISTNINDILTFLGAPADFRAQCCRLARAHLPTCERPPTVFSPPLLRFSIAEAGSSVGSFCIFRVRFFCIPLA